MYNIDKGGRIGVVVIDIIQFWMEYFYQLNLKNQVSLIQEFLKN